MRYTGLGAAALLAGAAWFAPMGVAPVSGLAQDPPELPLREAASFHGSSGGLLLANAIAVRSAPNGNVFVAEPYSLHVIDAAWRQARTVAEAGSGPGSIRRTGGNVWVHRDLVHVMDAAQGLVHSFAFNGDFVESRSIQPQAVPVQAATDDRLWSYREMAGGAGFGYTLSSSSGDPPDITYDPGKLMWIRDDVVDAFAEHISLTAEWHFQDRMGPLWSVTGKSAEWDVLGDSVVVVANGFSGELAWYRFGEDGVERRRVSDSGLRGVDVTEEERRRAVAAQRELDPGMPRNPETWFPEQLPGISDLIADETECLWLRKRPASAEAPANTWRVVAPDGSRWTDVALPEELTVHEVGADRILGVVLDDLDVPVVMAYEFDRAALMDGMSPAPQGDPPESEPPQNIPGR